MKRFAAVKDNGTIVYTLATVDPIYIDGVKLGEHVFREIPYYISEPNLLNNFYWNDGWVTRPPKPSQYYEWDITTFAWIPNILLAKEDKKRLINKKREELVRSSETPLIYNGNKFTNDSKTRFNISEALNLVNAGISVPENFRFRTTDNINVPFSAEDIKNLSTLALLYKNSCYQYSWELKEQIDLLLTVEEVEAFDVNIGWP